MPSVFIFPSKTQLFFPKYNMVIITQINIWIQQMIYFNQKMKLVRDLEHVS